MPTLRGPNDQILFTAEQQEVAPTPSVEEAKAKLEAEKEDVTEAKQDLKEAKEANQPDNNQPSE